VYSGKAFAKIILGILEKKNAKMNETLNQISLKDRFNTTNQGKLTQREG
jgi:hypothetical protein